MSTHIEAIYENGVFRPLQPVELPEHLRVTVTIDESCAADGLTNPAQFTLPADRWQAFCEALDAPAKNIPSLHKLLTKPGLFDGIGTAAS